MKSDAIVHLSKLSAASVVIWYLLNIFVGSFGIYFLFFKYEIYEIHYISLKFVFLCCISISIITSSLFYFRKLYKNIFRDVDFRSSPKTKRLIAPSFMYYLFRPLFSVLFSIIVVISFAAFIHATTAHGTELSVGFLYFCMLLSAYGGIVTGAVVSKLEQIGSDKIESFGGGSA